MNVAAIIILLMTFLAFGTLIPMASACGEKGIKIVDSMGTQEYGMEKSACTKSYFPSDGNSFLFEKSKIKVTDHQAKHILDDYLLQEYGPEARVTTQDVQIPGHENHGHGHGNPQVSHGHYTWTFNVKAPGMYEGKAFPMYVDMETGVVYGIGCGLGAGSVVFTPDISQYPDTDYSDVDYHSGKAPGPMNIRKSQGGILDSISGFFLALFGLR